MNQKIVTEKVCDFLARKINESGLTHKEIADAIGVKAVNIIAMMKAKNSRYKVPLERLPALADILNIDAKEFLELAMREYEPEKWKVIEGIQGKKVTENESEIIELIREFADKRRIPKVLTSEQRELLAIFVESIYVKADAPVVDETSEVA